MFYKIDSQEKTKTNHVDFGLTDNKGRKVGAITYIIERELYVHSDQTSGFTDDNVTESGTYWFVRVQLTKDDKPFGATQGCKIFNDFNDVHPHLAKRLKGSLSRQAKKWGK